MLVASVFLCRRAKSVSATSRSYNLTSVGASLVHDFNRTLRWCCQANNRWRNNKLLANGIISDISKKNIRSRPKFSFTPGQVTRFRPVCTVSTLDLRSTSVFHRQNTIPYFPRMSNGQKITDRPVPGFCFCCGTTLWSTRFSTVKIISRMLYTPNGALKQKTTSSEVQPSKVPKQENEPEPEKLSKVQQLKKVFKEYGAVGVSFHVGISLISLGIFYIAVSSGINMAAVLCKLGFSESVVQSKMAAGTSTFVLAYAIHKLFAPVRISITLVSVPLIVRYLRKTGLFKPPPPSL